MSTDNNGGTSSVTPARAAAKPARPAVMTAAIPDHLPDCHASSGSE